MGLVGCHQGHAFPQSWLHGLQAHSTVSRQQDPMCAAGMSAGMRSVRTLLPPLLESCGVPPFMLPFMPLPLWWPPFMLLPFMLALPFSLPLQAACCLPV